jgi:molecular chaperone DnaK (HSP70)
MSQLHVQVIVTSTKFVVEKQLYISNCQTIGAIRDLIKQLPNVKSINGSIRLDSEMSDELNDNESTSSVIKESGTKLYCDIELFVDPTSQPAVGIDLGTTFTKASIFNGFECKPLTINSKASFPSRVSIKKESLKTKNVFDKANIGGELPSLNTYIVLEDIKRIIGKSLHDADVQLLQKHFNFIIASSEKGQVRVRIVTNQETGEFIDIIPQMISAQILKKVKQAYCHKFPNAKEMRAIITVPANFSEIQRSATLEAAAIAGIQVQQLVSEPTAAAIAYFSKFRKEQVHMESGYYMIFDFGGGTLDISIIKGGSDDTELTVVDTQGDIFLGGRDFDNLIFEYLRSHVSDRIKLDPNAVGMAMNATRRRKISEALVKLKEKANECKHALTYQDECEIQLGDIDILEESDITDEITITRSQFEKLIESSFIPKRMKELVDRVNKYSFQKILLAGGSSNIPYIQRWVEQYFKKQNCEVISADDVGLMVSHGAAHLAHHLDYEETGFPSANIIDILSKSLGVECVGDHMSFLLPKNTNLPASRTGAYVTASDYQKSIQVKVRQGESAIASDNEFITHVDILNLPIKKAGEATVDVTYDLDPSGTLKVTVVDKSNPNNIERKQLNLTGRLNDSQIKKMQNGEVVIEETTSSLYKATTKLAQEVFKAEHKILSQQMNPTDKVESLEKLKTYKAFSQNHHDETSYTVDEINKMINACQAISETDMSDNDSPKNVRNRESRSFSYFGNFKPK